MAIDFVRIERSEIEETGEFDLEGLFIRLDSMIRSVGAKRVALDTVEGLFSGFPNEAILRAEFRRLLRWFKDRGLTVVITGERGEHTLTRNGLEEYVSDCVILLDHRVENQIATRRLRVVKYRGSSHGTNEYPMLIDEHGLWVSPISSLGLTYPVSTERISSGIPRLDAMLGGEGFYRGSSVLVSGTSGTGKSSIAAAFANAACSRGERCLYFSFEESAGQVVRNMRSIGMDLDRWTESGLLQFTCIRPTVYGLEMHLANLHKTVEGFHPSSVVMDPITNLLSVGDTLEVKSLLVRLIDFLKNAGITTVYTSLTEGDEDLEMTEVGVSSLMDTWLLLKAVESDGERNRLLYILKSRGMAHSNQMREFRLTDAGIELTDVYIGPGTVLTGSARIAQEARDKAQAQAEKKNDERRSRELERERAVIAAQVEALKTRLEGIGEELEADRLEEAERSEWSLSARSAMRKSRMTE